MINNEQMQAAEALFLEWEVERLTAEAEGDGDYYAAAKLDAWRSLMAALRGGDGSALVGSA